MQTPLKHGTAQFGQYDQRADSAAQCIQLLTAGDRPVITSAKVIAVKGDISDEEFSKIKSYIINPVESREASMEKPETLDISADVPSITTGTSIEHALISSLSSRFVTIPRFLRRDPSLTELKVIDTYWSDHCRHTTFSTKLDSIVIEDGRYKAAIEEALNHIA